METARLQEVTKSKLPFLVLFRLALPISLSRLLHVFGHFIVMMMVARQGDDQLAAGSLAISSYMTVLTLTSSIFYAIGILIRSQPQPSAQTGKLISNALFLATALALPGALSLIYMDKLLLLLHQDTALVALTREYFFFSALGLFPMLWLTVILQFYLGTGKAQVALWLEMLGLPLTLLIAYMLVPGHFGLPQWGLAGVSLASLMVQMILLCGVLYFLLRKNPLLRRFSLTIDWPLCTKILKLGLPIGIQFGGELAVMACATYLMGYFGTNALAALQITNQYALVVFMLNFGLSQALALTISEAQRTQYAPVSAIILAALCLFAAYIVPVIVVFAVFSRQLTCFYIGTDSFPPAFYALSTAFFLLSAGFLVVDGLRNLLTCALRGFHDSRNPGRINLLSLWGVSLPLSAVAAFGLHGGPIGLRLGFLSGFIVAVMLLSHNLLQKLKRGDYLKSFIQKEGDYA
ncbi:MATE family efflux transporter [Legionella erythra]|uniref:MATE efflux family protein n=1 Tax=Legionella erythra TaxID=448 RepID=A0A0W0TKM5_LEGER|nr:MATE family efflux transporter [Legionella erythra]KTC96137.1 MATE efflux family protein [Legionella erythra]